MLNKEKFHLIYDLLKFLIYNKGSMMQAGHTIDVNICGNDEEEEHTVYQAKRLSIRPQIIQDFKREAVKLQTKYFQTYRDKIWWSGNPKLETIYLQSILAQGLFGYPIIDGASDLRSAGYTRREYSTINTLVRHIKSHFSETCKISSILVLLRNRYKVESHQIFRIWDADTKQIFLDCKGRVYKDWDSYLNENTFLTSVMCCPIGGIYRMGDTDVIVEYPFNPISRNAFCVMDVVSTIWSFFAIILFCVAAVLGDNVIWLSGAVLAILFIPYRVVRVVYIVKDGYEHT